MDVAKVVLTLKHDKKRRTVLVTATPTLTFTAYEVNQMQNGLRYRLDCKLYGDDVWYDDHLFTLESQSIGATNPSTSMVTTFTTTVGQSLLNEDWGKDEIYAYVQLYNPYTGVRRSRRSPVVSGYF